MLYPSHYSRGWFGLEKPNDHPGVVVAKPSTTGWNVWKEPPLSDPGCRISTTTRPRYGSRSQRPNGRCLGWMLWNARSRFQLDALDAPPELGSSLCEDPGGETTADGQDTS